MGKSPGHRSNPDHRVQEQPVGVWMKVELEGELLADSIDVVRVVEDGNPVRYYFPRSDVSMSRLERSPSTSSCPYKGHAHYYSLKLAQGKVDDAVWTYEDPYEEHHRLQGRLAFWEERIPGLRIEPRL
jgi:uncharacterized protein (DUF427 family)